MRRCRSSTYRDSLWKWCQVPFSAGDEVTEHVFLNGILVAGLMSFTGSSTPAFSYLDSTHLITGSTNTVTCTLGYYPYGSERIATGENDTDRHLIMVTALTRIARARGILAPSAEEPAQP